ncbi:MAG: cytidine deaminase [Alphaproteobacteria bacterium]|jgi:cytidine deaminase
MIRQHLDAQDHKLIAEAQAIIERHFKEDWHHIGVACLGKSGAIYTSVNMDTYVGGMAVCGEPVAIGQVVLAEDLPFKTIVAVRKPRASRPEQDISVVSPCGKCREMIADYAQEADVILIDDEGYFKMNIENLLPYKFTSNKSKKGRHDDYLHVS